VVRKATTPKSKKNSEKFKSAEDIEQRRAEAIELLEHQEDAKAAMEDEQTMQIPEVMKSTDGLLGAIREGYKDDTTFSKIVQAIDEHSRFQEEDGLLFTTNTQGKRVLCIPRTKVNKRTIPTIILDSAHTTLGHFGHRKTSEYVRQWYWWPNLGKDVVKYCASCGVCQTTKTSTQLTPGLLHPLPIPTRPWQSIAMDFVGPFPQSEGHDYLWVVTCRMTLLTHLIPVVTTIKASELAWLYVKEIVRLHGIAESIVSDRDPKFTATFWKEVQRLLGTRLLMSTAFHPQTDGATERANRSIIQILRSLIRPDQKDWVKKVPMTEFAINSSASSSTGYAAFELTQGYLPRMAQSMPDSELPGVQAFAQHARDCLLQAHDSIIESRVYQTHQANTRRRDENRHQGKAQPIEVGDLVYLATDNLNLPKGRAKKLLPKYIGPYKVIESKPSTSNYTLDLPEDLKRRRIHPTFHISRLRRHERNDDVLFPHRETQVYYDLGTPNQAEWVVDEITTHKWEGKQLKFKVLWNLGDVTWDSLANVDDCAALDNYLDVQGVSRVEDLPRSR
jgi:hypothetical protein